MSEENKRVMRHAFEEIIGRKNVDYVDRALASDFAGHDTAGETFSRDDFRQGVLEMHNGFSDPRVTIEDQLADGDKVVTRWRANGIHSGTFRGIPATGRSVSLTGISIDRIANGTILESWEVTDDAGLLKQLGVLPEPELAAR